MRTKPTIGAVRHRANSSSASPQALGQYYHDRARSASEATESNGGTAAPSPGISVRLLIWGTGVGGVGGSFDEELRNVCDAACQRAVTKRRSIFRPAEPWTAPLNLSFLPFPPFPPLFPLSRSPSPHATLQPPFPFPFSSSSSSSSRQSFVLLCRSDTFLKHGEQREKQNGRGWRGRRDKRE